MYTTNVANRFVFLFAERTELDALPDGSPIRDLAGYWDRLPRTGDLPSRAAIDPGSISPLILPWIFLLDVLREGDSFDYRYRLVGTGNVELVGRDPTGCLVSEIFADSGHRFIADTFHATVREAVPTYWRAAVPHDQYERTEIHRGLYPLADDGRTVDRLLCIAVPNHA